MNDNERGGCSLIASPDGHIIKDIGKDVGALSAEIDHKHKYMRTAGFGGDVIRNDEIISSGLRPDIFSNVRSVHN